MSLFVCLGSVYVYGNMRQPHTFLSVPIMRLSEPFPPLLISFPSSSSIFDNKRQDSTGLTTLLQNTDLVGVLHMLYCILLHNTVPEPQSGSMASLQEPYSPAVVQVALQGLRFLNSFALLDLTAFQVLSQLYSAGWYFRQNAKSLNAMQTHASKDVRSYWYCDSQS